jgi:hypothetical protein
MSAATRPETTGKASPTRTCEEIKKSYDACFKEWYTDKFLKGDRRPGCLDEWDVSYLPMKMTQSFWVSEGWKIGQECSEHKQLSFSPEAHESIVLDKSACKTEVAWSLHCNY